MDKTTGDLLNMGFITVDGSEILRAAVEVGS